MFSTTGTSRLLLSSALLLALSACGGGSSDAGSGVDTSVFQGSWTATTNNRPACFNYNSFGGAYWGSVAPFSIVGNTATYTIKVYSDSGCTNQLGNFAQIYSVVWALASVPGKSNVAKITTTLTSTSGNGQGFTLTSPPALGTVDKGLFYVSGTSLYTGNTRGTLDADGYPTTLNAAPDYIR